MFDLDQFPDTLPEGNIEWFFPRCLIERIYDGDTITVTIDHGFGLKDEGIELRLFGINAPELKGSELIDGKLSRDFLRDTLCKVPTTFDRWGHVTNGAVNYVNLQTVKVGRKIQGQGKYGRYLAVLWHPETNVNLNRLMVDQGLARLQDY